MITEHGLLLAALKALRSAETVMAKHIYPKPDVGPDHPYEVLKLVRDTIKRIEQ